MPVQRNAIALERVKVDDEDIVVSSRATVWVNQRALPSGLTALLPLYNDVLQLAKQAKAKLHHRTGIKKRILAIAPVIGHEIGVFNGVYQALKSGWLAKIDKGLFSPACDDPELLQLGELSLSMHRISKYDKPLGQAIKIQRELLDAKRQLTAAINAERQQFRITL